MNQKNNERPEPSGEPDPGDKAVEQLESAGGAMRKRLKMCNTQDSGEESAPA